MRLLRLSSMVAVVLTFFFCWGIIGLNHAEAQALGSRVIKQGMKGDDVKALQKSLNTLGYNVGTADGSFGYKTTVGVKAFQKDAKLVTDGIVGSNTVKAVQGAIARKWKRNSVSRGNVSRGLSVTSEELTLLARVAYSEARGESYEGKVAVVAVVLNRLKKPNFPRSISDIIFEPWAFTAVNDGQFWLTPDQVSYQAARDAVNGWDPTGGALYYYNPAKTTNKWIWSRPVVKTIGSHVFAK